MNSLVMTYVLGAVNYHCCVLGVSLQQNLMVTGSNSWGLFQLMCEQMLTSYILYSLAVSYKKHFVEKF
jgi:hypothetical protein